MPYQPFKPVVIDNRPSQAVFMDSNPLSEGIANFASSLVNAPLAAEQLRREQAQQGLENAWRQSQIDQQARSQELNELWHRQGQEQQAAQRTAQEARQARLDAIAMANLGLDVPERPELAPVAADVRTNRKLSQDKLKAETRAANVKAGLPAGGGFLSGILPPEVADVVGSLFGGGAPPKKVERPTAATLKAARDLAMAEAQERGVMVYDDLGEVVIKDPAAWNALLRESYKLHGIEVPKNWAAPGKNAPSPANPVLPSPTADGASSTGMVPAAAPMPTSPGDSFWTPRRSGRAGIHSLGDISGGLLGLWGTDQMVRDALPPIKSPEEQERERFAQDLQAMQQRQRSRRAVDAVRQTGITPQIVAAYAAKHGLTPDQASAALTQIMQSSGAPAP